MLWVLGATPARIAWLRLRLPSTPRPHGARFAVKKKRGWVLTPVAIWLLAVFLIFVRRRVPRAQATRISTGRRRLRLPRSFASRGRASRADARRETFSTMPAQNIDMISDVPP